MVISYRVMLAFPDQARYVAGEYLLYYCIHDGNTLSETAIIGRQQGYRGDQQVYGDGSAGAVQKHRCSRDRSSAGIQG